MKASSSDIVWSVYIIENEKGHFYTGITTNLERRFQEHLCSKKGAKFFRSGSPKKVVFVKTFSHRSLALKFEFRIKQMKRTEKIKLIEFGEINA